MNEKYLLLCSCNEEVEIIDSRYLKTAFFCDYCTELKFKVPLKDLLEGRKKEND